MACTLKVLPFHFRVPVTWIVRLLLLPPLCKWHDFTRPVSVYTPYHLAPSPPLVASSLAVLSLSVDFISADPCLVSITCPIAIVPAASNTADTSTHGLVPTEAYHLTIRSIPGRTTLTLALSLSPPTDAPADGQLKWAYTVAQRITRWALSFLPFAFVASFDASRLSCILLVAIFGCIPLRQYHYGPIVSCMWMTTASTRM